MWFRYQVVNFFDCEKSNFLTRLNEYLDNDGKYVEKKRYIPVSTLQ